MNEILANRTTVLIVGHGSRDNRSNSEFEQFVSGFQNFRPDLDIQFAYIELVQPDLKTALRKISQKSKKTVIIPLFLFTSGHVKNDIPLAITSLQKEFPTNSYIVTQSLGIQTDIIELLRERALKVYSQDNQQQSKTGVIIISRGSSDADANSDFYKAVRIFEEGNNYSFVRPCFIGIARPSFEESLEMAARLRPEKLLILPYFLFGGKLIEKIDRIVKEFSDKYSWIHSELASYFGPDPKIYSIMDRLLDNAVNNKMPLACPTCEYRTQLPGLPDKVGGLKALLWSVRHMETHTQAAPHEFPHKNLKKHVLVCGNVDCAAKGSIPLLAKMRLLLKRKGKLGDFKVSKTSCMGRCGEGPVVVVYPDGIWYQKVNSTDVDDIVNDHLLGDNLVSRLVDNIMQ